MVPGRNVSDPMQLSQTMDRRSESRPAFDELCEALMPSASANTILNEASQPTTSKWNNELIRAFAEYRK